jgi:preprotein translocase subunit Sec63
MKYFFLCILVLMMLINICSAKEDYYETLSIDRSANSFQIKKAFKKLALKW